jgi:TolB-like protein/class 3 adenylate cyclase
MFTDVKQRKFAAILAVDVVGYTRLMEVDEDGTHRRLMQLRGEVLDPTVARHSGRIVKNTGDGFLAAFDDVAEGLQCAVELQTVMGDLSREERPDRRLMFRMGVHASEAIVEKDDIFGEGVNIAARLQNYAAPGDIVVSSVVVERVGHRFDGIPKIDLGDIHLKNMRRPVRATELRIGSLASAQDYFGVSADNRPSIAVLPFRKIQPSNEDSYFADGFVEEIVNTLAGLKELFVVSRTSTLRYSGRDIDVRTIGRELGVRYVLYGSVRRSQDRLRIAAELIDAETGRIIHAEQFDGTMDDLFEVQAQISLQVLKTIAPHVRENEVRRAMRKHPESLTAYDLVLQALEYLFRLDYESHSRARGLLQQAIIHDPAYALAHTYTAYWHIFRVGEGWSDDPDADAREAARVARTAIDHDRNDALALAIHGHVQSFLLKNYHAALSYLDRALEVGPNCATAWSMSSATRGYLGEGALAVEHAQRGLRLSPLDAHVFWHEAILAQAYYINGNYDSALAWAQRAMSHNASAIFNLRTMAASQSALGRLDEAQATARWLLGVQPKFALGPYAPRCPFIPPIKDVWIERLRMAGFPE